MSTTTKWSNIKRDLTPEQRGQVDAVKSAMRDAVALAELRSTRGKTQVDVAKKLGISQGNVSQLERRTDVYLSSLEAFVESLGGKLRLVASFPDGDSYPIKIGPRIGVTTYKVGERGDTRPSHVFQAAKVAADPRVHPVGKAAASKAFKAADTIPGIRGAKRKGG